MKVVFEQSVFDNAKVYATRMHAVKSLIQYDRPINFMEIGVGIGDWSLELAQNLNIDKMFLLDHFFGYQDFAKKNEMIGPKEHEQFVLNRFSDYDTTIVVGDSYKTMPDIYKEHDNLKFDFIYIDADHNFKNVYSDLVWSAILLKDDGIIGLDDFCFAPKHSPDRDLYEVQEALSLFLEQNPQWSVTAVALNNGYTNIFIKKGN